MLFRELPLAGAFLLGVERHEDARGFFGRTYCAREFEAHGLSPAIAQINVSYNKLAGTLRGMHFQRDPHEETKVVRCTRGEICDVIVDLRPASPTYLKWHAERLTEDNRASLYIPAGFAHGFQTLTPDAEVLYLMGTFYAPDAAAGIRYDDPAIGIVWPREVTSISDRDRTYPLLTT